MAFAPASLILANHYLPLSEALYTKETMATYIEQCNELSLTARVAIALKVFDGFCAENSLSSPIIDEFTDYLWKWPLIDGPDQFTPWESSKPFLVNYGIGDETNFELNLLLSESCINEFRFREIVGGIVEILWGSFWGGCENEQSLNSLNKVIEHSSIQDLPNLTPFKFSKFSDNGGWGNKVVLEDVIYWKSCVNYV